MPGYLIAIAVGPVQNFIAAARRTHDLWFGSYMLSEVSKAVASTLCEQKAELIFPAPNNDLKPDSSLNVPNKLLAYVVTEEQPANLLKKATNSAHERWRELAQNAISNKKLKFGEHLRQDIWNSQIDDVLELYSAWVKLEDPDPDSAYMKARERVEQLLKARKNTRDFKPAALSFSEEPYFGLPKSSLDATRETVLQKLPNDTRLKLRLGKNEQLDCPGVAKRFGGNPEQFSPIPITRIALETWLHGHKISAEALRPLNNIYEKLVQNGLATRVKTERYQKLPFETDLLFPDRIDALRQEIDKNDQKSHNLLNDLEKERRSLYKKYGEPTPYYAVLVADGDKMGAFLDDKGFQDHQEISQTLDVFASNAREIVKNEAHRGAGVYAGGDDVMALLPIDTAVACAEALREAFEQAMSKVEQKELPTLSVGLGLTHVMTPFSI